MAIHDFGVHIVRLFASQQPEMFSGRVLIDPSHEDQDNRRKALVSPSQFAVLEAILAVNPEGKDLNSISETG